MPEGVLAELSIRPAAPADYTLHLARAPSAQERTPPAESGISLHVNPLIGNGLQLEFKDRITCCACAADTPRSYGDGHCWSCFRRLARCDLCVVSPARCHYHLGTCREPAWGEGFCMRPHLVYLANSSGPKVGITAEGREVRRWLDQGAVQGLVVARAATRHLAGVLEERLSRLVSDRTHWRALLGRDAPDVDLPQLARALMPAELPAGVVWLEPLPVVTLRYPVLAYPGHMDQLELAAAGVVAGRLVGIKGQYLLFEHGVFNVRRHRGYHVRVSTGPAGRIAQSPGAPRRAQMELFS